jgi:hypothetical protein
VTYGQVVSGSHTPAAEVDAWTFTGATADMVAVHLTSAFQGSVWISRPDGTTLCSTVSFSGILDLACTLDRSGAHAIWVTDRTVTEAGTYSLQLLKQ